MIKLFNKIKAYFKQKKDNNDIINEYFNNAPECYKKRFKLGVITDIIILLLTFFCGIRIGSDVTTKIYNDSSSIVENFDSTKNDKLDININKKESFDNDTISVEFNTIAASLSSNKNDIGYLYINSIYTYDYDFYYVDNVPNLRINYLDIDISWFLSFYIANYGEFEEISLNSTNDISLDLNFHLEVNQVIDINNFYVTAFAPIGYANSDETIFSFLTEVVSSNDTNLNYSFAYVLNENDLNSFLTSYEQCALSLFVKAGEIFTHYDTSAAIPTDTFQNQSVLLANLNEFIVPKVDLVNSILIDIGYNTGLVNGSGGGASREELENAYSQGMAVGYESGYIEGYQVGTVDGFNDGYSVADGNLVGDLIFSIVDIPFQILSDFIGFDILGFNVLQFVTGILGLLLVAFLIKMFIL